VRPLSAGDVDQGPISASYEKQYFKRFSEVEAKVTNVHGEFYWAVSSGETVTAEDFIRPPEGLSREQSADEVSWSHATYVTPKEVAAAFKDTRSLPSPKGAGALQPNPRSARAAAAWSWAWKSLLVCFALLMVFLVRAPEKVVFEKLLDTDRPVPLTEPGEPVPMGFPQPAGKTVVFFSVPFEITHDHRNVEVQLVTDVDRTWAAVSGALINEATLEVSEFELEAAYYHGESDGESWSEGDRAPTTYIPSVAAGKYVVRLESQWETPRPPPAMRVTLKSGVARWTHFILAMVSLLGFPILLALRVAVFEAKRWEQSNLVDSSSDDDLVDVDL
jgi:hypothetical protein